jgi:hypothetical protein
LDLFHSENPATIQLIDVINLNEVTIGTSIKSQPFNFIGILHDLLPPIECESADYDGLSNQYGEFRIATIIGINGFIISLPLSGSSLVMFKNLIIDQPNLLTSEYIINKYNYLTLRLSYSSYILSTMYNLDYLQQFYNSPMYELYNSLHDYPVSNSIIHISSTSTMQIQPYQPFPPYSNTSNLSIPIYSPI